MNIRWKLFLFAALLLMLAITITLSYTFWVAYSSPDKAVLVRIDVFGEADSEFLLLIVILGVGLTATIKMLVECIKRDGL